MQFTFTPHNFTTVTALRVIYLVRALSMVSDSVFTTHKLRKTSSYYVRGRHPYWASKRKRCTKDWTIHGRTPHLHDVSKQCSDVTWWFRRLRRK